MPRTSQTVVVDAATAETMLGPRRDVVEEREWTAADDEAGPGPAWAATDPAERAGAGEAGGDPAGGAGGVRRASFALVEGPMARYRRDVEAAPLPDGTVRVVETTRYRLVLGPWSVAVDLPIRSALRRTDRRTRRYQPVWAPPDPLDERAGTILGLLLTLSLVIGYLSTVLTQTITYAAEEFGRGTTAQGTVLAIGRVGVLLSLVIVARSDRRGRRRLLLASVGLGVVATVAGAFAPTIEVLGFTQTLARAFATAATLLLTVVAAEEMPAGARAYSVSVLTMAGALGAGVAVWALPLSDIDPRGWRILFLLPLLAVPLVLRVARRLPESQRFVRPHRDATLLKGHGRRLVVLGAALFCASAFAAPASQLLNDFLRDERGFSGARISLFTILTSTPAGLALVAGGRLADRRGRRLVVAIGVAGGAAVGAWGFTTAGWPLWMANLLGTMLGALAVPAMGAYGPELFPTAARARANGVLQVMSVAGSALGLVVAGVAKDRTGHLASGMFLLLPLALLVAVLALTLFPETARRELEDINPEDDLPDPTPTPGWP
ncbi:MAG: MFS transporter [Acidimicrobiales bacterium]|nr:MFS transporter [Acidimicrobiales bacterium]